MRAHTAIWLMDRDQAIKSALSCDRGIRLVLCSVRCSHTGVGLDPSYLSSRFREWLRSAFFSNEVGRGQISSASQESVDRGFLFLSGFSGYLLLGKQAT